MRYLKSFVRPVLIFFLLSLVPVSNLGAEEPLPPAGGVSSGDALTRDFLLMSIYGTMSGMIIGAASLAFTDRALTKLRRVAIGASLGLYVGILLGGLVILDRTLPSKGGGIFDVPTMEEEVPIVFYEKKHGFALSLPTLLAMQRNFESGVDPAKVTSKTWFGAQVFKMKF